MPILLQLKDGLKRYGARALLDGASCALDDERKVGLIGRNGSGKSTLCRVLLGEEELDSGELVRHPQLRIGYLRQHDPFQAGESVLAFLMRDTGQPDWKCGEVAGRFEIKNEFLNGPVRQLSGGWQTRVKLAALLLQEPNLLILDEPTNFLDLRTQILLEHFLKTFRGGALIVSHDRTFLKDTCEHTLALSRGKLTHYPGDVDAYLEYELERKEHDERANAAILSKRKQLERFIAKNRAHANTASQARSKAKQLERLETIEIESDEATAYVRVPQVEKRHGVALRARGLDVGYPERTIAKGIDLEIHHGERVVVVGDNGEGKTTLLRSLVGSLPPKAGESKWGHGCEVGTYAQHVYTTLPEESTVEDYLAGCAAGACTHQVVLNVAGSFLFRGDDVKKPIRILSGGERARACLAGLLLGGYNVLVLDEPGNHLDVETVDAFAEALTGYKGTVVFTSHDRAFTARVATNVIEVRDGRAVHLPGDFEMYRYKVEKEIEAGERERDALRKARPGKAERPDETKEERKARSRREYETRREIQSLERKIEKYGARKAELEAQLEKASNPEETERLKAEHEKACTVLEESEARWLELQETLDA
ncbi:MAG: ABC-F family ATP-binding cassette domain-containing protein [Planctomycetota bacterium]|nr:ABC-F family ATP-binding cassette domain-containing protein [Planctomycetota bacterium]